MTVGVAFEKDVFARGGNDEVKTTEIEAHPTQKRHALRRDGVRQGIRFLFQPMLISLAPVDASGLLLLCLRVDFAGKNLFPDHRNPQFEGLFDVLLDEAHRLREGCVRNLPQRCGRGLLCIEDIVHALLFIPDVAHINRL